MLYKYTSFRHLCRHCYQLIYPYIKEEKGQEAETRKTLQLLAVPARRLARLHVVIHVSGQQYYSLNSRAVGPAHWLAPTEMPFAN
jgi:hypothetical protein